MPDKLHLAYQDLRVLYDLSIYNCTRFGPYTEIIYDDQQNKEVREYSNIEVAKEATQLAAGLQALGIEKGDRVIVMMPNCPEVVIGYQAIARAGAVIIPTLADLSTIRYIISTGIDSRDALHKHPQPNTSDKTAQLIPYQDVVTIGADKADLYLQDLPGVNPSSDDMAVILYTSGTTGSPKGVILSHRNLVLNAVGASGEELEQRTDERQLAILPLAHAYGIVASNVAYLTGVTVVMHPRFDTKAVLAAIEHYKIVAFAGVPAMFVALLYAPDAEKYDTSSLQYCVSGSAPLPVSVLKAFEEKYGCQIREGYGLSEASAVLTGHGGDMPQKPGSVGVPLPGIEVKIVDGNDTPLSMGEVGEVVARGPNIMVGYYNMPEETASAMRNGWLHTGDMGYFDEDGYLYIVERKKDLIIRGGFNIYPRDVEEVLATHPAVIEAAVVGVPSERMGEEVKAFVVAGGSVDAETLMVYCRERLANYKTPSQIEFVDALPRNPIGKIDKKELRNRHVH